MADSKSEWRNRARLLARVFVFWCGYIAILWLASLVKAKLPQEWGSLAWGLISSVAILAFTFVFLWRENRRAQDIGLSLKWSSWLRLLIGILLGFVVFSLQILIVDVIAGPIHLTGVGGIAPGVVISAVLSTLALACMEELGFRGYPLRTLVLGFGLWPAQGIVAVAFGLCHFAFGWSWQAILLGVIPSALLFGMAAIASRGLALPIGLHTGLNLAQSSLRDNSSWGFVALVMNDRVRDRVGKVSPLIGTVVVLLAMLGFWWWQKSREEPEENATIDVEHALAASPSTGKPGEHERRC